MTELDYVPQGIVVGGDYVCRQDFGKPACKEIEVAVYATDFPRPDPVLFRYKDQLYYCFNNGQICAQQKCHFDLLIRLKLPEYVPWTQEQFLVTAWRCMFRQKDVSGLVVPNVLPHGVVTKVTVVFGGFGAVTYDELLREFEYSRNGVDWKRCGYKRAPE